MTARRFRHVLIKRLRGGSGFSCNFHGGGEIVESTHEITFRYAKDSRPFSGHTFHMCRWHLSLLLDDYADALDKIIKHEMKGRKR